MSPWEVMGWALAALVIGCVVFALYTLTIFGIRLTMNFIKSQTPSEPPAMPVVNMHDPDAIRNGMPVPARQPQMFPHSR